MTEKGILLVLSGPSGVGKTTIARRLRERPGFVKITTCTTRERRPGETSGTHYHFMKEEDFREQIDHGAFIEYAEVHDRLYGTPREEIQKALEEGSVVVLDIDVQGAREIRKQGFPSLLIFIMPPDQAELLRRLRGRKSDTEERIERRLKTAEWEMRQTDDFDLVVINERVEGAVSEILQKLRMVQQS